MVSRRVAVAVAFERKVNQKRNETRRNERPFRTDARRRAKNESSLL